MPVWILSSTEVLTEVAGAFLVYTVLLGSAVLLIRSLVSSRSAIAPISQPKQTVAAITLMVFGPVAVWQGRLVAITVIGPGAPVWIWTELPWLGGSFFALGWVLVGATLRPAGSAMPGVILAGAVYVLVGFLWTIGLQLSFGRQLAAIVTDRDLLLFGLLWPLQIVQLAGLFGLGT